MKIILVWTSAISILVMLGVAGSSFALASGLPLQPARTASFSTDEGTWMSVDVSPDGGTLVFDLLGDIYSLPMEGGHATPITRGMAFDMQPRYSPDGSRILFMSDRSGAWNLWTMNTDGSMPKSVTTGFENIYCSAEWAEDGVSVLASHSAARVAAFGRAIDNAVSGVTRYFLDGSDPVNIRMLGAGVSPCNLINGAIYGANQEYVYYSVRSPVSGVYKVGSHQIERLDLGGGIQKITKQSGGAVKPVLSHDGRWLVYVSRQITGETGLRIRNVESGEERWLVHGVQSDAQGNAQPPMDMYPGYSFTPDDKSIITSYDGKLWRIDVADGSSVMIPFVAAVETQLGPLLKFNYPMDDKVVTVRRLRFSRLSPDGQKLAFNAAGSIWVADVNSGAVHRLTKPNMHAMEPAWSPDGRSIAFTSWNGQDGGAVYQIPSEGDGAAQKITNNGWFYRDITYGPAGELFASSALKPEENELSIVSVPVNGGDPKKIGMSRQNYRTEGGRIHFVKGDGRVYFGGGGVYSGGALVSIRQDGMDKRTEIEARAVGLQLSPRGDRALLLTSSLQLFLVTVPGNRLGSALDLTKFTDRQSDYPSPLIGLPSIQVVSLAGADFFEWNKNGDGFYYTLGTTLYKFDLAEFERRDDYKPRETRVTVKLPAARPSGNVVLRGAKIITMKGDEIIENGDIVVTNNRIAAIGQAGRVDVPVGAMEIDVRGKTILPGWIDLHAHAHPRYLVSEHSYYYYYYATYLAYGVTTTRDPAMERGEWTQSYYEDQIKAGLIAGPRIIYSGVYGWSFAPHGIRNYDDVLSVMQRYGNNWKTGLFKQYRHSDRRTRQWIAMAAQEFGLTLTNEGTSFAALINMIVDGSGGIEHAKFGTPIYGDVVQLLRDSGTVWTPTLNNFTHYHHLSRYSLASNAKLQRFYPFSWEYARGPWTISREEEDAARQIAKDLAAVVAVGGKVGFGSHGNVSGMSPHWELWDIASGGMPLHDVFKLATIGGADAIGHAKDLGSIEVGKLADLQVLDRNPLDDVRNTLSIRYVMKNGFLYKADTLDQMWPESKPFGHHRWQLDR